MPPFISEKNQAKIVAVFVTTALFVFLAVLLSEKINLVTADLGRHIMNGEIMIHGAATDRQALLHSNFYSYTEPGQEFVNHHWGSGPVFYLVYRFFGFSGVSALYVLLGLGAFYFFFDVGRRKGGIWITLALSFLVLPVVASRAEVRPEIFSYFFSAFYFWVITGFLGRRLSAKWLYFIPAVQIIWLNLHIGFVFGLIIIGTFLFARIITGFRQFEEDIKKLSIVFGLAVAASFVSPFGVAGFFYPIKIFANYGYRVVENQSIWFLERLGVSDSLGFPVFKVIAAALVFSFAALALGKKRRLISASNLFFALGFGFLAANAIRHFPIFGFFALPALAENFHRLDQWFLEKSWTFWRRFLVLLLVLFAALGLFYGSELIKRSDTGWGIKPGILAGGEFFKTNGLTGPIFNNYDVGGYLIFSLFPKERVFVDNRPEAYPADFLEKTYIEASEQSSQFYELDKKYHFNSIFYYYRDYTPWGQKFIIDRITDPEWAPVFADRQIVILVRRNAQNLAVIKKYQIPASFFRVAAN
jgi:hypothetical protein